MHDFNVGEYIASVHVLLLQLSSCMQLTVARLNWEKLAETAQALVGSPTERVLSVEEMHIGTAESADILVNLRRNGHSESACCNDESAKEPLLRCAEEESIGLYK
jgi:hypothetical protein